MKSKKSEQTIQTLKTDLYSIMEAVLEVLDSHEKQIAPYIVDRIIKKRGFKIRPLEVIPGI